MGFKDLLKNTLLESFPNIDKIVNSKEYENTGKVGEQVTYRALWYYFKNRLFRNVYVRDETGKLTEIDLVGVGERGIYVFESKNYSGNIYGNGKYKNWLCYLGKKKFEFYNPILQNSRHIQVLKHHFDKSFPDTEYFSIIIFSIRSKVDVKNVGNAIIVKRDDKDNYDLDKKLKLIANNSPAKLSIEQIERLCQFFKKAQRPPEEIKTEHLNQIGAIK